MLFNFGSINLDLVYRVPHLPLPGETLTSLSHERHLGGKGINQSIAAARAGGKVVHIGCLGSEGGWLRGQIAGFDLPLDEIATVEAPTGHAVIYVDDRGENQIVLFAGANRAFTKTRIERALDKARAGDWVLLQNETNLVSHIARQAQARGLKVAYSAAPFDAGAVAGILDHINLLALNEGEAAAFEKASGRHPADLELDHVLITRGANGADLYSAGQRIFQPGFRVETLDTTGAGDTFLGAFMAKFKDGQAARALEFAAGAAALQVTRQGAATAIPTAQQVQTFLRTATAAD